MIHSYDFKHQVEYRASFNRLSRLVFGIDFEAWFQKGCWDDRYICHSIVSDKEIISNISVSKMDLVINGVTRKAIQIGTVMTHPEHRGKGLSKKLMKYVLETYENTCDLLFLFANSTVLDFYPKFGFETLPEFQFFIDVKVPSTKEVSLDRLISSREEETDNAIIVFENEGEWLHLYDVVSEKQINVGDLISRISTKQTRKIRFHFTPDQLIDKAYMKPFDQKEDVLFIKPLSDLGELPPFCVPKLAHA